MKTTKQQQKDLKLLKKNKIKIQNQINWDKKKAEFFQINKT